MNEWCAGFVGPVRCADLDGVVPPSDDKRFPIGCEREVDDLGKIADSDEAQLGLTISSPTGDDRRSGDRKGAAG